MEKMDKRLFYFLSRKYRRPKLKPKLSIIAEIDEGVKRKNTSNMITNKVIFYRSHVFSASMMLFF